jgi:hypothetical protein
VDDGACTREQIDQFKEFVINLCSQAGSIAEELSRDALSERGQLRSVCEEISVQLQLPYRYCDPSRAEREAKGIRQKGDLDKDVFMGRLSPADLAAAVRLEHAKRESIWLGELRIFNTWPVLFICGAKHARPFSDLLNAAGFESTVIEENWLPNPPLSPITFCSPTAC